MQIGWVQTMQEMMNINDELTKFRQQLSQFEMAIKEIDKMQLDIKEKRITKVLVPTLGNNFVQVNPNNDHYQKLVKDKKRQFENSIGGIKGQIEHREDHLHEMMIRTYNLLGKYLVDRGFELQTHEKPKEVK